MMPPWKLPRSSFSFGAWVKIPRPTTGAERERLWRMLVAEWPAYLTYEKRAAGRRIRVYRLEPTGGPPPDGGQPRPPGTPTSLPTR